MAAPLLLTSESSGAPTLNGVNGSLPAVLRWALVQNGWTVEYGPSGNAAVFRPGSGNRFRLYVNHDNTVSGSAALATVRGCEDASSATTLIDPFPTVAQVANDFATWIVSATVNATARRYKILVGEDFVILSVATNSSGEWDTNFFGDMKGARAEDAYNTAISCRNSQNTGSSSYHFFYNLQTIGFAQAVTVAAARVYWCRDITGMVKSSKGNIRASSPSFGYIPSAWAALSGYGNRFEREKVALHCTADASNVSSTLGIGSQTARGWVPNLWGGMHSAYGAVSPEDTFADTEYDPTASFTVLHVYQNSYMAILETTDTWSPPNG